MLAWEISFIQAHFCINKYLEIVNLFDYFQERKHSSSRTIFFTTKCQLSYLLAHPNLVVLVLIDAPLAHI